MNPVILFVGDRSKIDDYKSFLPSVPIFLSLDAPITTNADIIIETHVKRPELLFHHLNVGGKYITNDQKPNTSILKDNFHITYQGNTWILTKSINSFDLFDTLIFRVEKTPESIFYRIGDDTFVKNRKSAESKTLEDTYQKLQKIYGWSDLETQQRMKKEMEMEYSNIFPIIPNVRKVRPGDIIISDMYLSETFLSKILKDKCGLTNKIYVSPDGKFAGYIWNQLKPLGCHLGDNIISDGKIPEKYGIKSCITSISEYTPEEKYWVDFGQPFLAHTLRYIRLQCPYQEGLLHDIYHTNIMYNIPCLLFYVQHIREQSRKYIKILFSMRDTYYLYLVYKKLFPTHNIELFYTSRRCYYNPSPEFNHYVEKTVPDKSLIIDLNGTGKSFRHYFGKRQVDILYLNNLISVSEEIECYNQIKTGTLLSFDSKGPVLGELEYPEYIVDPLEACVKFLLRYIELFYNGKKNIAPDKSNLEIYLNRYNLKNRARFLKDMYHTDTLYIPICSKTSVSSKLLTISDIPIYLITMEKSDRIFHMEELLKSLGAKNIYYCRPYPANEETRNIFRQEYNLRQNLSLNQISHSLTYYSLLRDIPEEECLIIEDDIIPINSIEDTKNILNYILNHPPSDADLIYLEYCYEQCKASKNIFERVTHPYCTAAIYYPSKKSRDNILKHVKIYPDILATDAVLANLISENKIIAYEHQILFKQDDIKFGSFIDGSTKDPKPLCINNMNKTLYAPVNENNVTNSDISFWIFALSLIIVISLVMIGVSFVWRV